MTPPRLDLVADYNLEHLAAFLAEQAPEQAWPVVAIDGAGDAEHAKNLIRGALRCDPDALLLRPRGALDPHVGDLLRRAVQTGHAVLLCDAEADEIARFRALFEKDGGVEPAATFLARLPGRAMRVRLRYQDVAQAPLPEGLTAGCDRYDTGTGDRPANTPAPAVIGERLALKAVKPEVYDFEPPDTREIVPVTASGDWLTAIARAPLPAELPARLEAATAHVVACERMEAPDEAPGLCAYRLLLDVPSWIGEAVVRAGSVPYLSRAGRSPIVTLA